MPARDDPTLTLRATMWRASLLQAAACVLGLAMACQAIQCAFLGHHGHAIGCAIGVAINLLSFEIAAQTRALARAALGFSSSVRKSNPRHPSPRELCYADDEPKDAWVYGGGHCQPFIQNPKPNANATTTLTAQARSERVSGSILRSPSGARLCDHSS